MLGPSILSIVVLLATPFLHRAFKPEQTPRRGAVASQNAQCTDVGTMMLERGGNAVDAAVATQICIGTVAFSHSGIGGGGFLVLRTSDGKYESVDYQVQAPAAANREMFGEDPLASLVGGLASAVPGELRGLEYVHKKYANLDWADLIAPSIRLAEGGFNVTKDLVRYMRCARPNNAFLMDMEDSWATDFLVFDHALNKSRRLREGETMTRKRYAKTLRIIAERGPSAFYDGEIAKSTIQTLRSTKYTKNRTGIMTLDDLGDYKIRHRKPVSTYYRGYKITSSGAPSSGAVTLSVLNTLNGFAGFGDISQTNVSNHRMIEAFRWAFGQRSYLGDPDFVDNVEGMTEQMLSADVAASIRSKISDERTFPVEYYNPEMLEGIETPGTAHIATADGSGMAVSSTTTIGHWFGSHVMVEEAGYLLNSQMSIFSRPGVLHHGFNPNPNNFIQPNKRPLSAISPVIIETPNGELYAVTGSAGQNRIITAVVQNIIHMLDGGMTAAEALVQPRMHDELNGIKDRIQFEWYNPKMQFKTGTHNSTVEYLQSLGHAASWVKPGLSTGQSIRLLPNGTFEAAGEPRQVASKGSAV
ncbi:hypothetical protein NLG97_g3471 [Lecanicillium saksenae]|uniref:Uncharacterized protein n=1 Tax=Lecanicillium saksenae TaxID=468837 RepID=A0ACC1R1A5_9HYPO|nr:hypothetical protein NLG97_g3471 [Lecanicillium saksenae]